MTELPLKHEEPNKVHLIKTNSKIAAAHQTDSIFQLMAHSRGFSSSFYIYTSGTFSKSVLFCTKEDILRMCVVSHHWSGIVPSFLLKEPPNSAASMLHKLRVETVTYICLTT